MIWHDRKIVFIHIPKCGGTSVRKAIQKKVGGTHRNRTWLHGWKVLDGDIWNQHATYDQYSLTVPKDYMYIAQVRNPFDRWESLYFYYIRHHGLTSDFNQWTQLQISPRLQGNLQSMLKPYMWVTQYYFIPPDCEVHRLEDKTIWNVLGKTEVHRNKSRRQPIEWTEESRQLVRDYFKCDFKEFGYDIT